MEVLSFHAPFKSCFDVFLDSNYTFLLQAVELKVEMVGIHSERRLRKCLVKTQRHVIHTFTTEMQLFSPLFTRKDSWGFVGVEKVEVELSKKKVVVRGEAEQSRMVKALRRNGFTIRTLV